MFNLILQYFIVRFFAIGHLYFNISYTIYEMLSMQTTARAIAIFIVVIKLFQYKENIYPEYRKHKT